uniref:Putative LAGLIDADG homing endonuclease n=1 Tax=Lithotrichon pulchrum TaxID=908850 RepID=A0A1C7A1A9_9CHLO|nr:putative LAGLIDADG homing endonuclease [Lithotrichon pulchrum]
MKEFILKMKEFRIQNEKPSLNFVDMFNSRVKSRGLRGAKLIAYKQNLALTEQQKEVIIGKLLGDASIRTSQCNFCVKFEQKYTQIDYIIHLYEIFEPYVGTGPKMRVIQNTFHRDYGVSCWFRTYSHIDFKYYENRFYQTDAKGKRRKVVPQNIHQMLTPRALAYWFMDDGSYIFTSASKGQKSGLCCCLNTQGFTYSEQKVLIKALKQTFDLDVNRVKDRNYYRLVIQTQSENAFKQLIEPFILPSLQYKLKKN